MGSIKLLVILILIGLFLLEIKLEQLDVLSAFVLWWNTQTKSTLFFLVLILVSLSVFLWARFYISSPINITLFFIVFMRFVISIALLISRDRLFSIFLGWEGLGVRSFLLVIFYQNWSSAKGGLLTLLTNRLGDALLIILLSYWLVNGSFGISSSLSNIRVVVITLLVLTKSAQWPFFSWLPAAIAAPTPVRALVHSSTLVTAGIWLTIQFGQTTIQSNNIWLTLGVMTLTVARLSALIEKDGKKIVALSTLSQLGLIFTALRIGNRFICLFHLITHALAKANLFIMVGNLLHKFYSEQDARFIFMGRSTITLIISLSRIFRLTGLTFRSVFYRKEAILSGGFTVSRAALFLVLLALASLTFTYCTKLILFLEHKIKLLNRETLHLRIKENISPIFLRILSLSFGFIILVNSKLVNNHINTINFIYWTIPLLGLLFLIIREKDLPPLRTGFANISKTIDNINRALIPMKHFGKNAENKLETIFLSYALGATTLVKQPERLIIILPRVILILIIF